MKWIFFSLALLCSKLVFAQVGVQWPADWSIEDTSQGSFNEIQSLAQLEQVSLLEKYQVDYSQRSLLVQSVEQDPLGVFCKLDANMDLKLPFKMRFRLGEYHYTNGLEYGIGN